MLQEQTGVTAMQDRQQQGLDTAQDYARILKEEIGAIQVILLGSFLEVTQIDPQSDIDVVL